jgi:hypothetical protein
MRRPLPPARTAPMQPRRAIAYAVAGPWP